jgi:hypothetical protein
MSRIIIGFVAALALLTAGCHYLGIRGNGKIVTTQRSITEFNEISASGGMKIEWHSGPPSLSVTTDENLQPYFENRISGSSLRLYTRKQLWTTHGIKVTVSSQTLRGADVSGAVDLIARNLTGPKFYVRASGFSDITLDGNVDALLADLTGAGDFNARELQTRTAEVSATGATDALLNVSEALRVSITGAGDVTYWGNPKTIKKNMAGLGSIRHRD